MIGKFKIIAGQNYLQVNEQGTLEKLPPIPWYKVIWLAIKQHFVGHVNTEEVRMSSRKPKKEYYSEFPWGE